MGSPGETVLEISDIRSVVENLVSAQVLMPSIVTFFVCLAIVLLTPAIFRLIRARDDVTAVQSAHTRPTLRIGGIGILIGILTGMLIMSGNRDFLTFASLSVVSAIPLLIAGFSEDWGFHVSPRARFISIAVSAIFCAVFLGSVVSRLGIPGVDQLLSIYPIALAFSVFAATGVTNAFNLIDGLNGLASLTGITTAVALSGLALIAGIEHVQLFCALIALVTFGFFALNYPFGKLFLGDGGAYLLGHLLVWSAIYLLNQIAGLSPFAVLLIFFWPVADTVLAIWRRVKLSTPTDRPDRLHFHQLAMRFLEIRVLGRNRRSLANPLATLLLAPLIVVPQLLGLLYAFNHGAAVLGVFVMAVIFFFTYALGMNLAKRAHVAMAGMSKQGANGE